MLTLLILTLVTTWLAEEVEEEADCGRMEEEEEVVEEEEPVQETSSMSCTVPHQCYAWGFGGKPLPKLYSQCYPVILFNTF